MKINDILKQDNLTNQPIILVMDFNSNANKFMQYYIENKNPNVCIENLNDYLDLYYFDCSKSIFKKQDAINLQEFCSFNSIDENNKKFYYIVNFELSTKEAFNCLLKFIEEPLSNVYGVLTTSSINNIPYTIRSRCQIFNLSTDWEFIEFIKSSFPNIEPWALKIFYNNELLDFINSEKYIQFITAINFFINKEVNNFIQLNDSFKVWSYLDIKLFLQSLLLVANDEQVEKILIILETFNLNINKSLIIAKLMKIFY